MSELPDDFAFRYHWSEASLPPPYYYEYTVEVAADGTAQVTLLPDYPQHHPQARTAKVVVGASARASLYALMDAAGIFSGWQPEEQDTTGGSQSVLEVTADAQARVVAWSDAKDADLARLAQALGALVPRSLLPEL